ncbi:MAG: hypothetical protein JXB60_05535 [Candidatus Cloacimonetes bacterium]|nr:hypothetical protein [Candidatus Cloacimonadota bacterium]
MRPIIFLFMLILNCSALLTAKNHGIDTGNTRSQQNSLDTLEINLVRGDSLDIFIDKDGDGICDNRNFRERNHKWREIRMISQKMFEQRTGQPGKKAKLGNPDDNGPGNGHGGGNGGGG